jgi:hypothetical protein
MAMEDGGFVVFMSTMLNIKEPNTCGAWISTKAKYR